MKKKEFLNEDRYQQTIKNLKTVSLCVIIIGFLIGGGIIVTGLVKTNELKKENKSIVEKIEQKYDSKTSAQVQGELTSEITSLQQKVNELEKEIATLEKEQRKIFLVNEPGGLSDDYYAIDNEIMEKRKELSTVETNIMGYKSELSNIKSGDYESKKQREIYDITKSEDKYDWLYGPGVMIIFMSCLISGGIYLKSKQREIIAFSAQQVMPVAQEGMKKMAPSVAVVGKAMAEEMSQVYKEKSKDRAPAYGKTEKKYAEFVKEGTNEDVNKF